MTRRRGVSAVLAVLVAAGWLLGAPGAAFAVKEREPLNEYPCGSGPTVGKVVIKDLNSGGVKVKVRMKNGDPDTLALIRWIGMDAPGCNNGSAHPLGTMLVDGGGKGRFSIVLPGGNPFPGKFVRINLDGSVQSYEALFDNIFQ